MVCNNFELSYKVGVKYKQHLHPLFIELKETTLSKANDFLYQGEDGVFRYQKILCVPNVHGLRKMIMEEDHGYRYSINLCNIPENVMSSEESNKF